MHHWAQNVEAVGESVPWAKAVGKRCRLLQLGGGTGSGGERERDRADQHVRADVSCNMRLVVVLLPASRGGLPRRRNASNGGRLPSCAVGPRRQPAPGHRRSAGALLLLEDCGLYAGQGRAVGTVAPIRRGEDMAKNPADGRAPQAAKGVATGKQKTSGSGAGELTR